MKKSYRPRARRRSVSVRLPRMLADLLLVDAGYYMNGPVPASSRGEALQLALVAWVAGLVECTADDGAVCMGEDDATTSAWLNWYAGLSSLDAAQLRAYAKQIERRYEAFCKKHKNSRSET